MRVAGRNLLAAVARQVRYRRDELRDLLTTVQTRQTADIEMDWILAALEPPPGRLDWLDERDPIGTVFVATPATMPMYSFVLFGLAPAVAGNRVVVRAASSSRDCAHLMAQIAAEAGADISTTTAAWPEFAARAGAEADGVVFAGSRDHIRALDTQLPERVTFIGQGPGVAAGVVTASADIAKAARTMVWTRAFNSSQDCLATERVYVADEVFNDVVDALLAEAHALVLGPNSDAATDVGPLLIPGVAHEWFDRLRSHGRVLRAGGPREPGLFDLAVVEADPGDPVVLEETFCPVLPVVRYRGLRELHRMLALGEFALGLTVAGDLPSAGNTDFAHIAVNESLFDSEDAWAPFGGYRGTTVVRGRGGLRRSGPVLIPYELTRPRLAGVTR